MAGLLTKHRFGMVATGDFFAVMLANTLFGMVATGDFSSKLGFRSYFFKANTASSWASSQRSV